MTIITISMIKNMLKSNSIQMMIYLKIKAKKQHRQSKYKEDKLKRKEYIKHRKNHSNNALKKTK